MHTQDQGNNETISRGVFELHGKFTAMTFSQSKTFKTRKGAEAWLARHGYNPDGSIRSYQPKVWQNPNGTWSHHRDSKREWGDPVACRTDLLFTYEMHPND